MFNGRQLTQIEADLMRMNSVLATVLKAVLDIDINLDKIQYRMDRSMEEQSEWTRKIVDSLVEFTLATGPEPASAAMHRAQVRLQEKREVEETLSAPAVGSEWPPPGHTILRSKG